MSHEKGIEAAAAIIYGGSGAYTAETKEQARAIIAAYLAEAGLVRLDEAVEAVETMYAESNGPNWDFGYNTARAQSAQALRALTAAQPTSEGEEREAFEMWCGGLDTTRSEDDYPEAKDHQYVDGTTQVAWLAWQARSSREGGK